MILPVSHLALVLAEAGADDSNVLAARPGLAFWFLITFIIVAAILRWKVWGPLGEAISAREKGIQDAVDQAKKERELAEKLLAEQQASVAEARKEMAEQIRRNQAEVEKAKEALFAQARAEAETFLKDARRQIEEDKRKAMSEVREVAVDLAISAASKLVQQKMDDHSHRQLAEEFIANVQKSGLRAAVGA